MNQSSVLSTDSDNDQFKEVGPKMQVNRKGIGIILIVVIISLSIIVGIITLGDNDKKMKAQPIKIRIALPPQSPFPILLGNSRVIQILFYSGFDNRTLDDYKTVTQRSVIWQTNPQGIVSIDPYGRLETLSIGKTNIKVKSKSSPNVFSQRAIEVIKDRSLGFSRKRIVNYEGTPAVLNKVMQKIVIYKSKDEALKSAEVPQSIKDIIVDPTIKPNKEISQQNGAVWKIEDYADGSNRTFIKRARYDYAAYWRQISSRQWNISIVY